MKQGILRLLFFLFLALLLAGGFAAYDAYRFLSTPASDQPQDIIISIAPGATFDRVAWDLKKAGAITDVDRFRILAYAQDALGRVKAGEFQINTGWTPEQVLRQITEGQAILYRLSVREGLTWWETARAVEAQGFARYEDFKAVIHDPDFLREHNIPFANAEGFLFPETYLLKKPRNPLDRQQAYDVASTMVRMFWKKSEPLWQALPKKAAPIAAQEPPAGAMSSPAPTVNATAAASTNATAPAASASGPRTPAEVDPEALRRLVTLASLVEKETGVPAERGLVAGVYANRLRLGMLLQCDPTIIYGIGENFSGAIRRSQIDDPKNRYNTYQHPGLPPGPIASPGLDSLRAAAAPDQHDFLYFVATGVDDGHTFSKTLNEHNKAVQVYRSRIRNN
ncbi:MAG: endolytic transglycosylase MltG [Desulfovibrionaceae bacterium]|nr:endolytic transglycosylase MltG [Desulfovibrionaceae bacterium]